MSKTLLSLTLFFSVLCNVAFAGEHSSALVFTARMNGASEEPSVTTDGRGVAIFTFDEKKSTLYINVSLSNLSGPITGIHIHEGVPGENGPVIINLTSFLSGNRVKGTVHDVSKATMAAFLTGGYYINAHTELNPDGEIRGQIKLETDLRYAALLNGNSEVPEVTTDGRGLFIAHFSADGNKVDYKMIFEGLTSPVTAAHIHQGAIGSNGGVILDLSSSIVGNVLSGTWDVIDFIAALTSSELYVNVHTVNNPDGEIRGQILLQDGLTFDASFDGAQENPSVDTRGKALAIATVRPDLSEVEYFVVFDSLSGPPSAAHFHTGNVGANGGVVINMSGDISGNTISGSQPLTLDLVNQMLEGGLYMNIHTAAHPGGEIRGQVYKFAREPYIFDMNGGQEVPSNSSTATGAGVATIDRDETNVHFMMVYSGLQGTFSNAHFHYEEPGVSGPVIFGLASFFDTFGFAEGYWNQQSSQPFDAVAAEYFTEGEVYANIHSSMFPGGEIRGNLFQSSSLFTDLPFDPKFGDDLIFAVKLRGNSENPPVTTDGFGLATFYFKEDKTTAYINVTVHGLSGPATAAHIHEGIIGVNGPVIFPLNVVGNRIQMEIPGITPAQFGKFVDGSYYINVHTAANPGGEIRGQIFPDQDGTLVANLEGAQEVPAITTDGKGLGAFHYTIGKTTLEVNVQLTGLSSDIISAHLHAAVPGENGDVIVDLTDLIDGHRIQGTVDLTLQDIFDVATGGVYVNVHTSDNPGGEIRGQLTPQNGLTFDGWMSGLQENPFTTSGASAFAVATVSPDLSNVNVWMTTDAVSGIIGASHFHRGAIGTTGPVVLNFSADLANNALSFTGPIASDVVSSLLTGEIYINAHTPAYPGGELRGQMFRLARDGYGFDMCTNQEVAPINAPNAQGSGLVSIDRLHSNLNISIVTDGLTGDVTAAHFHEAPIDVNGGVIFPLTKFFVDGAMFENGVPMDTAITNAIIAGNVYANVHTALHPGGELRGQIVKEFLCEIATGNEPIEEITGEVLLSPNPVTDELNISVEVSTKTSLDMDVYDLSGKRISTHPFNLSEGKNDVRIETADLTAGFYLLMITDGNATKTYKFVK
ncbi:MAG TPA: CHRD domain-containing protein [Saprospiraceae bacterium]|nr:CHRD domain-containing protein [Saprospiraceae bacterium]